MGIAVIEEYANLADVGGGTAQIPGKPLAVQTVTTSASSARTSSDFDPATRFLIISSNVAEAFELGDSSVTAATTDRPLYASSFRAIEVNGETRIALINK